MLPGGRRAAALSAWTVASALAVVPAAEAEPYSLQETYWGEQSHDQFGFALASIADVTGDGFGDFLVGANVNDDGGPGAGKVYLFLGGATLPRAAALTFAGDLELGYVGGAVAGGEDIDGDGFRDWVVGAPGGGPEATDPGRVYVFLGGPTPDFQPDLVLEGDLPGGQFGAALALIPDFDGDGFADLAVGAPRAGKGRVAIFQGGPGLDAKADAVLVARANDLRFGKALAVLPDNDGDGRDDLLVGAPRSSEAATWSGVVLLFRGSALENLAAETIFRGEAAGDEFGSSLAAGADIDGDGEGDLLVGAPSANPQNVVDAGKIYFFRGGDVLDTTPDLVLRGIGKQDRLGSSVAMGFDWDGDGDLDLAGGAPNRDAGAVDAGAVYIFRGGGALDASFDRVLQGPGAGARLGKSVALGGDVQHNGHRGLLAGGFGQGDAGHALYYGVEAMPTGAAARTLSEFQIALAPNPFRETTTISFSQIDPGLSSVSLHDAAGRVVREIPIDPDGSKEVSITWDGKDRNGRRVCGGIYFVRIARGAQRHFGKAVFLGR